MRPSTLSPKPHENNPANSPNLVASPHCKPADQETSIKSIFSHSTPDLDLYSTQPSSPCFEKKTHAYLTPHRQSSGLSEKDVKISDLFTSRSKKKETALSDKINPLKEPASFFPNPVENGKIIFSSDPIKIPHTYHCFESSSSSGEETESSDYTERSEKTEHSNIFPFDESTEEEERESSIKLIACAKDEDSESFLSEESTDKEESWIEELSLQKMKSMTSPASQEKGIQDLHQGISAYSTKKNFKFKLKTHPKSPQSLFAYDISPLKLDSSKEKLSESSEEF